MNPSVKSIEDKNNDYKKIIEKNDGKKYHDIIAEREKNDRGVTEREYKAALELGQQNADTFMAKALSHQHPEHAASLSTLKDKYGGQRSNVEKDFKEKAVKLLGAKKNEKENTAYVNKLYSMFKITTPEDQAYVNKFKEYLKNKHSAVGYANDLDFVNDFFEVHPMSTARINKEMPVPYHN